MLGISWDLLGFSRICWDSWDWLGTVGSAGVSFEISWSCACLLGFVAISSKIYMKFVIMLDLKETEFHKKRPTAQNGFNISPHMGQDSPKMVS